jgi:hypothetical protein
VSLPPQGKLHDLIHIGPDGRIHAVGDELRKKTSIRSGLYLPDFTHDGGVLLVPVGPDVKVPREIAGDIQLSGAVDVFGTPAELISLLANARRDGQLTFMSGPYRRSFTLKSGRVISAISNDRYDRLGEVLYRSGIMDRHQLADLLNQASEARRPIGNHLVQCGVISKEELYALLKRQADDIFLGVLDGGCGDFLLTTPKEPIPPTVDMDAQHFLLDAVRRLDEIQHLETRLYKSRLAHLSMTPGIVPDERPIFEQLADQLRQPKSPTRLFEQIPQPRRFVIEALGQMMGRGWVNLTTEETTAPTPQVLPVPVDQNIETIERFNQLYSLIAEATRSRDDIDLNRTLRTFLQFYGYTTLFGGALIDDEGTIEPSILLPNLNRIRHPQGSTQYLERALSELLHFTLFATRAQLERDQYKELQQRASGLFRVIT